MRCQKLVNSMSRRIKQCLKSKGGTFKKYWQKYQKKSESIRSGLIILASKI